MMHCHVCQEDVPLSEIENHVRLFHPDAYPISEEVEVHVDLTDSPELRAAVHKMIRRDGGGSSALRPR